MNLRSSCTPPRKSSDDRSEITSGEIARGKNGTHVDNSSVRFRRHKTYPCDYVSEFSSLSLIEANSVKGLNSESGYSSLPYDNDRASSIDTYSIYSESTCDVSDFDDDDDDLYSEVTYQSSLHRPVKRRKFSNTSDIHSVSSDDVYTEYSFSSNNSANPEPSERYSETDQSNNANYSAKFWKLLKLLLFIFFFFVFISTVLLLMMSVCVSQNKQIIPIENIKGNLSTCLIGHQHSVPLILNAIDKFNLHYLEKRIYFILIIGPIGVGKSFTKQLIRSSLGTSVVSYSVLSPLLPKDMMSLERVIDNLVQSLDVCKPNVIFVDGFDEDNDVTYSFLEGLFEHLSTQKNTYASSVHLKVLIIAFGTQGSSKINQYYLKHIKNSGERHTFNYDSLQKELYYELPFSKMTEISLHFSVVPFLPLEVKHLKECIIHQLNTIAKGETCNSLVDDSLETFLKESNVTLKQIQDEVLKLSSIQKTTEILHTGCKRIYQLISSLLFQFPSK